MAINDKDKEQAFLASAKTALDQSLQQLDADTLRRLRHARHQALEGRRPRSIWWLPAAGLTAVSLAALSWVLWFNPVSEATLPSGLEHLEMLSAADNLDLYSDLEFYDWLAEDADAG